MTLQEQLASFAIEYHRPFTREIAASMLGVDPGVVGEAITQLVQSGELKRISTSPSVFVSAYRWENATRTVDFVYTEEWAVRICDLLEQHKVVGIRQLGSLLERSREFAYRYLIALVSITAVAWLPVGYRVVHRLGKPVLHRMTQGGIPSDKRVYKGHYVVLDRSRLAFVGTGIKPGCLSRRKQA
jgi:predicted transcriptional regulator of viral defense system